MIRPVIAKCFVCGRRSTRLIDFDGITASMCSNCPDPTEVYERAAELREAWPPWRWEQAKDDERHGRPIAINDICRIGHSGNMTHQVERRGFAAD